MSKVLIRFDNVSKYFKKKIILENVNLELTEHDFCLLSGENGTGKTTIIKLILGIISLKGRDKGSIYLDAKRISYLPEVTILPDLLTGKDFLGGTVDLGKAKELSNLFELDLNTPIHAYSKGMKQKLSLIFSLSIDANLYVLDEPLTGLDTKTQKILIEYLKESKDRTFLISTHNENLFKELHSKRCHIENHEVL